MTRVILSSAPLQNSRAAGFTIALLGALLAGVEDRTVITQELNCRNDIQLNDTKPSIERE